MLVEAVSYTPFVGFYQGLLNTFAIVKVQIASKDSASPTDSRDALWPEFPSHTNHFIKIAKANIEELVG